MGEMKVGHTPGPWFIEHGERGSSWPITVTRWNPSGVYTYESLTDDDGRLAEFQSVADARAAIAKAEGRT